jgi:aryl-alcohol dehydrogenase-like predicted oxidoreductase
MELRKLGDTDIEVTPVAMGCWPISGITSIDVTLAASLATLEAALDAGINFFDTAYCYGFEGESESMIGRVFGRRRDQIVIATKGGLHWENGKQAHDGSPATLKRECEESLRRLGTDRVELLYLHAPDPKVPVAESAAALKELLDAGKTRSVGLSNSTVEQLVQFSAVCPLAAFQPHYNMLQREIEAAQLPWCREHGVSVIAYWPLMKGLLAGKLARDHVFDARDGRRKYPMFQGDEWTRNQDFLDELRPIAADAGKSVAELVINWTIHQPGITVALCGAKRPEQICANAGGMGWRLSARQMESIERAIARRGAAASRGAV